MSDPAQLYNVDFYRWTQEQAALLRQVPGERINLPIDWDHAAEEIEDIGSSDLRAVNSRMGLILEHLLKLQYSPAAMTLEMDGWKRWPGAVATFRESWTTAPACGASFPTGG